MNHMKVAVYNKDKEEVKTISLDEAVFNVKVVPDAIHEVVRIMRGNVRKPIAHAKDRGAVSGGGKKPWRQKGTGRARHGSIRSPLWRKGGVTHGPLNERVFKAAINRKAKLKALVMVLSSKAQKGLLYVVTDDTVADFSKTKSVQVFADTFLKNGKRFRKALLVHTFADPKLARGVRNMECLSWVPASGINVMDLVNTTCMIATESSVNQITSSIKKS